jgi:hypothetical protein
MTLQFMADATNVVLVGGNGLGKTMCACNPATAPTLEGPLRVPLGLVFKLLESNPCSSPPNGSGSAPPSTTEQGSSTATIPCVLSVPKQMLCNRVLGATRPALAWGATRPALAGSALHDGSWPHARRRDEVARWRFLVRCAGTPATKTRRLPRSRRRPVHRPGPSAAREVQRCVPSSSATCTGCDLGRLMPRDAGPAGPMGPYSCAGMDAYKQ